MKELFPIDGKSDEELIAEYSMEIDGRTFVPARLLDAIGERQAREADRKPGDPGTAENPIFRWRTENCLCASGKTQAKHGNTRPSRLTST